MRMYVCVCVRVCVCVPVMKRNGRLGWRNVWRCHTHTHTHDLSSRRNANHFPPLAVGAGHMCLPLAVSLSRGNLELIKHNSIHMNPRVNLLPCNPLLLLLFFVVILLRL